MPETEVRNTGPAATQREAGNRTGRDRDAGETGRRGARWLAGLAVLYFSHAVNDGNLVILSPVLPLIAAELSLSPFQVGLIVSAFSFAAASFQLPASFVADHTGRKKTIFSAGLLLSGLSIGAYGLATGFHTLLPLVLLAGVGFSSYHPASVAILTDQYAEGRRGFQIGIFNVFGSLGGALYPVVMGFLAAGIGWRAGTKYLAVLAVATALSGYILFGEPRGARRPLAESLRFLKSDVFLRPPLLILAATSGLNNLMYVGTVTFIPFLMADRYGWNSSQIGMALFLFNGVGLVSQPILGYLSDVLDRRLLIFPVVLLSGAASVLLPLPGTAVLTLAVVFLLGMLTMGIRPLSMAAAADYAESGTNASSIGLIFTANTAVSSLAPAAGGLLIQVTGSMATPFLVFGSILMIGSVLSLFLNRYPPGPAGAHQSPPPL